MLDNKIKNRVIFFAGIFWGLSGFSLEVVPENADQSALLVRFFFVITSVIIIFLSVPFKIKQHYLLPLALLLCYIIFFTFSAYINGSTFKLLIRELLLFLSFASIAILFSDKNQIMKFVNGLYISLTALILYYFINIDFANFWQPLYRLSTHLGPNGISARAVMFFILALYFFYTKEKDKYLNSVFILISIVIVFATRSRTSIVMLIIAYFALILLLNKKKTFFFSFIILLLVIVYNLQTINILLRVSQPQIKNKANITNLTGRIGLWQKGMDVISENVFWGVGPDRDKVRVQDHWGSYHNAYIQYMVTTGFLGFFPILLLIIMASRNFFREKNDILFKSIFVVGILGSFTENRLLNFGSPGNLLFLVTFVYFSKMDFKHYTKMHSDNKINFNNKTIH